ncbi:MAG TPA: 30S ribosomal protein S6, partial [Ruminococcaceae bacterium]|nr:30S ribosomal protein S6 [Oscillospiraceae bacterium]
MSIKHKYETLMVFSLKDGEESVTPLVDKFKSMIEQNGTVDEFDEWGKRRLAYPINDEPEGYYVLVNYTC